MKTIQYFVLYFTVFSSIMLADIIHVPTDTSSIQAGINIADNGDTVLVADGTYFENINFKGKAITVASYFLTDGDMTHIDSAIIDGSQPSHPDSGSVVYFVSGEDTTSVLCGFTITGGTGLVAVPGFSKIGGGIACLNSGAKVINNYIKNNEVISNSVLTNGGGIAAGPPGNTSWVVVRDNVIRDNSNTNTNTNGQANGGGILITANVKVTENIIEYNTVKSDHHMAWGGGIFLSGDPALPLSQYCINNKIRHNKALSPTGTFEDGALGGGLVVFGTSKAIIKNNDIIYNEVESNTSLNIDCYGAGVILQNQTDSTIFAENYVAFNQAINNSFCRGAGIAIWHYDIQGSPRIIKNIIANNTGGNQGGGVYIGGHVDNSAHLINNTIVNNSATHGGAVYIGWNNDYVSYPKIENSILWGNGSSIYINTGGVNVNYSDIEGGWTGTGNIDSDPLFADTLYHLSSGSPCIDAGNPDSIYNDPDGTRNDMGRYGGITDSLPTGLFQVDEFSNLPRNYSLAQNYPNPFNPSTTIKYTLAKTEKVKIEIFNLLGQRIETLLNKKMPAGAHEVQFTAKDLASGAYLYRIKAGNFTKIKKMVYLK